MYLQIIIQRKSVDELDGHHIFIAISPKRFGLSHFFFLFVCKWFRIRTNIKIGLRMSGLIYIYTVALGQMIINSNIHPSVVRGWVMITCTSMRHG